MIHVFLRLEISALSTTQLAIVLPQRYFDSELYRQQWRDTLSCIDNSGETHESTIVFMDTTDPAIQNAFKSQTTVRCG